ncbi:MAG: conjugal transfer protein TraD [Rickettsiaceae bacterium]|nr:conjugal transfer protein TraD [Rickettsiaceae bacterium]
MKDVEQQKIKLKQKKARMAAEETKLKIKERKMRTKSLIEKGGLITKARLDHLPTNALYGALLSLNDQLTSNSSIIDTWINHGKVAFDAEQKSTSPVIIKFDAEPNAQIKESIRSQGLRYNRFRSEWYGNVANIESLKQPLEGIKYNLEIIDDLN